MIQIIDVSKEYQGHALKNVSLTIPDGVIFGIVGKSGSGKSTLLRLLNLMEAPTSGKILFDGEDADSLTVSQRKNKQQEIGMVFQQFNLLSNLTVFDNIALPLKLIKKREDQKVWELLEFMGISDKAHVYPAQLSGGEKQRVALARALVRDPKVLLCDEATSALDEQTKYEVIQLLRSIHQKFRPTILFVSHELSSVKQLCELVVVMEKGRIIGEFANIPEDVTQELSYLETVKRSLTI